MGLLVLAGVKSVLGTQTCVCWWLMMMVGGWKVCCAWWSACFAYTWTTCSPQTLNPTHTHACYTP